MGELAGWERPNWYAENEPAEYQYTYGKPNWFEACQRECDAIAKHVALFDQSSYPIFHVAGPQALSSMQHICANNVDVAIGKIVTPSGLTLTAVSRPMASSLGLRPIDLRSSAPA